MILEQEENIMHRSQWVTKRWFLADTLQNDSEFLTDFVNYLMYILLNNFSDVETEVWTMANGTHKNISPSLPEKDYIYGVALYSVDFNFCRKW